MMEHLTAVEVLFIGMFAGVSLMLVAQGVTRLASKLLTGRAGSQERSGLSSQDQQSVPE